MGTGKSKQPETALDEAIQLARRSRTKRRARSLTPKEKRKVERSDWVPILEGAGFLFAAAPFYFLWELEIEFAWWIAPYCFAIGAVLWVSGWLWGKKAGFGYVDPCLTVEAKDDRIVVANPVRAHEIRYADAAVTLAPPSAKHKLFHGIVLTTPLGTLALDDENFQDGRTAAAGIVEKCRAAGQFAASG